MRAKFFLIIFFIQSLFLFSIAESRELSIKQLEERKKADEEREKARKKRGKKSFQKEITITTDIVFVSKERSSPRFVKS